MTGRTIIAFGLEKKNTEMSNVGSLAGKHGWWFRPDGFLFEDKGFIVC
jgi:hypothetical protein